MANHRVSLGFRRYSDADLGGFVQVTISCLAGNPAFPDPPVKLADLQAMQTAFSAALAATADGSRQATVIKNNAREVLLDALRLTAGYVQLKSGHDLATLLTSGFKAMSKNQAQIKLAVPIIKAILNEASAELVLRLTPVPNARSYQAWVKNGDDTWQPAGEFSKARRMVVKDLTPGTMYAICVRAVGGSTGYSDWSNPVSHMAI